MNILVTGGSGFLGSHVADALSEHGYRVTILDISASPYLREDQEIVIGDILDSDTLAKVTHEKDVVYHFAGIADIDACAERPVDTVRYNILGTVKLLEACRKAKVRRFVFASSAYVYSDSGYFYRTSKQACESLIENYQQLFGMEFTCVRYGSLYGTRADTKNSIYRIIRQAILDGKITYFGTGDEIREYIHVRDAAEISVKILEPAFVNQHIILTGTEKMRYRDLLKMVQEMLGGKTEIEILPSNRKAHYKITPYNFSPRLGMKMIANPHIDMGQGLLQCMASIYEEAHQNKKEDMGLFIENGEKNNEV